LFDEQGNESAIFTGDTLFVGDVGRPDLRENVGNVTASRQSLARAMYKSTRNILMLLPEATEVYPAHGAGSLCGKSLSLELSSTIGREIAANYALREMAEDEFVDVLLADQPFIPKYFGYDVSLNKKGAPDYLVSINSVAVLDVPPMNSEALLIDIRPEQEFKQGHIKGSINIQLNGKFETWLGSIVGPNGRYFLVSHDEANVRKALTLAAKIGYELLCEGLYIMSKDDLETSAKISLEELVENQDQYTILDVRNQGERESKVLFKDSLHIPLPELRERIGDIPVDKPVVVHCAAGYRSAAAQSILERELMPVHVFDLSDDVKKL
jgi:rhodanese-related sulfurtransferase